MNRHEVHKSVEYIYQKIELCSRKEKFMNLECGTDICYIFELERLPCLQKA